jgi:hypothetical protein
MTRRALLALPFGALAVPDSLVIPFCPEYGGPRLCFGRNIGSFFIHRHEDWWRVTHRRTALYAGHCFSAAAEAFEFAKRIEPLCDWASVTEPFKLDDPRRRLKVVFERIAHEVSHA